LETSNRSPNRTKCATSASWLFHGEFSEQVEAIRGDRTLYFPYASNHDIPWISTDDIGDEAAKYLLDDDWAGQWTCNLMGPENLTLLETTAILSQVLDLPLIYASDD